jgi:hypothetical protein
LAYDQYAERTTIRNTEAGLYLLQENHPSHLSHTNTISGCKILTLFYTCQPIPLPETPAFFSQAQRLNSFCLLLPFLPHLLSHIFLCSFNSLLTSTKTRFFSPLPPLSASQNVGDFQKTGQRTDCALQNVTLGCLQGRTWSTEAEHSNFGRTPRFLLFQGPRCSENSCQNRVLSLIWRRHDQIKGYS